MSTDPVTPQEPRYRALSGSITGSGSFDWTIIDTHTMDVAGHPRSICECPNKADALLIVAALTQQSPAAQDAKAATFLALAEKWQKAIDDYDNRSCTSDPEDWMAGRRECLEELRAAIAAAPATTKEPK